MISICVSHFSRLPRIAAGGFLSAMLLAVGMRASAQDAKPNPPGTYTWQYSHTKSDITRYRNAETITGQQPNGDAFTIVTRYTVKNDVRNVTDEGVASIVTTIDSIDITVNGQAMKAGKDTVSTQSVNKNGLVLSHDTTDTGGSHELNELNSLFFNWPVPDHPVKVGESWKTQLDNPFVKDKKFTLTSTLVGKETIFGIETLKVKLEADLPMQAGAGEKDIVHATGTYNVDMQAGRRVRLAIIIENVSLPTPAGDILKIKLDRKFSLVVPGVPDTNDQPDADKNKK